MDADADLAADTFGVKRPDADQKTRGNLCSKCKGQSKSPSKKVKVAQKCNQHIIISITQQLEILIRGMPLSAIPAPTSTKLVSIWRPWSM